MRLRSSTVEALSVACIHSNCPPAPSRAPAPQSPTRKVIHGKHVDTASPTTQDDFGKAVEDVAARRAVGGVAPVWTIARVNQWLDTLVAAESDDERSELFREFVRLPPLQQKWLIRVIIGDLKLGMDKEKVRVRACDGCVGCGGGGGGHGNARLKLARMWSALCASCKGGIP